MKKLMVTIAVMAVVGGLYAQQNDTIASTKADTVSLKQAMELQEVGISATKPVYMTDGEKTLYNVSEDPAVQTGTAADALQNTPGVEVDVEGNVTLRGVPSVEIWLNNRPANMNAEALKNFLQQLPASNIERIEVITNPSARYSAQGTGGIINIITVSNIKKNSFLSFGARGSIAPEVIPFISYVYSDRKFYISTYLHYWYSTSHHEIHSESAMYDNSGTLSSNMSSNYTRRFREDQIGLFVNATWTPDTANTFYFSGGLYPQWTNFGRVDSTKWHEYLYHPGDYSYWETNRSKSFVASGYAGLWYEHKFNNRRHKLSVTASYSGSGYWMNGTILRDYAWNELSDRDWLQSYDYAYHQTYTSLDYTIPYHPNGEIEAGVSGNYTFNKNIVKYDTLVNTEAASYYVNDHLRSMDRYERDGSFDAYVTLQHRFGGFTLKGGLRSEMLSLNLDYSNSSSHNLHKLYWGLFPSIHLSYRTKNMHNLKLSYTRRVNNPRATDLTTYRTYDEDSFSTGNPDLLQAYTNSVEAGWTKYIKKFGNIGVNAWFKNTKDEFSTLIDVCYDPYFGRVVSYTQPINAGRTLNTGVEVNMNYQLKTFMSIRFYGNLYYMKSSFQFRDEEQAYKVDNLGYSFRLNFWAKLWKVLEVNVSANYQSKSVSLFTTVGSRYSIDLGLRAEFWKHRIAVYVNVDDIFDWNRNSTVNDNPYFNHSDTKRVSWQARTLRFGLIFKLGRMELESAQAGQGQGERR